MTLKSKAVNRIGPIFFLVVPVLLLLGRGWEALQVNRAFVTLNHQPSVFTHEVDGIVLATVEAQLSAGRQYQVMGSSTQRMLAVVQQAQGQVAPAGITTKELLWWGKQKEKTGDWPAAAYLYQWATEQQPDLGDSWYHLGRVYETQSLLDEAITAYLNAAAAPVWYALGPSDAYLALGNLTLVTQASLARDYYEEALRRDQFGDAAAKAATHYQLGELFLLHEGDPIAAIPYYQTALTLTPNDHWAWLRLGYALYWGTGDLSAAVTAIQQAISIWPDEKHLSWPYFYLGEIYQNAGLAAEAVAAYERVLQLEPTHESAQQRLTVLRSP